MGVQMAHANAQQDTLQQECRMSAGMQNVGRNAEYQQERRMPVVTNPVYGGSHTTNSDCATYLSTRPDRLK
jgi:hypothetical protein